MKTPRQFPKCPSYQAVIRGLLRMHLFTIEGRDESEEADSLRESMSEPWEGLSQVERERVAGLSKDLYSISDAQVTAPQQMNPQTQEELSEAHEARERGEWDRALELLRKLGEYMPPALLSYLRGTIWSAAGDAETAVVFLEHASRLDPENEKYQAILLHTLRTAAPDDAAARAEEVLQNSEKRAPAVVVYAASIIFRATGRSEVEGIPTCKRLIPILEDALVRIEGGENVHGPGPRVMALVMLATCYEILGDPRRAYNHYSRAIQFDPTNDALLIARGKLVYGTDPAAIADFEEAIQLGSPLVWPYFYMAHYHLTNNQFEECRSMCERALRRPASIRVQSELCEFLAISLAGLGYPPTAIRHAFERAIRVDPSNDRARRNLERFNTALFSHTPQPKDWERPSESSIRTVCQEIQSDLTFFEQHTFAPV